MIYFYGDYDFYLPLNKHHVKYNLLYIQPQYATSTIWGVFQKFWVQL